MKRLPSLQTLQAFEASVRHGSFTGAADELHLTQGAISRHIQKLENWLGEPLFERLGPRIRATTAAERLKQSLKEPLQGLYQALKSPSQLPSKDSLYLSTLVSIAQTWILPHLSDFKGRFPHIDLTIATDYQLISIPPASKIVALRFGNFDHKGLFCEELLQEEMVAVASASWLERYGQDPVSWPAGELLIHHASPWPTSLKTGSGLLRLPVAKGVRFNDAYLCLQAAQQGLGIAWARYQMARPALDNGDLRLVGSLRQKSNRSYWLACREELQNDLAIGLFRQWLREVMQANTNRINTFS
ncbi:LysR substrate-binding domain-containing protein [Bowmanella dokdonensis]|uniref:LysR family transcriptional regulator n=1 Tax=Bowmanella dokdonensis TaxID=751969 RepID=A0A939IL20_9ALTE|nr:LysR substrate-binding domain-containing protein [Bowmanella dokdonensis]MBN7823753.1 LysR family transcriptional regulator [Bowmanella dokdonensis]